MPLDEDKAQARQAWHLELLSIGIRSPDASGTISSGAYHAWLQLTDDLLRHGAADGVFLSDSLYRVIEQIQREKA